MNKVTLVLFGVLLSTTSAHALAFGPAEALVSLLLSNKRTVRFEGHTPEGRACFLRVQKSFRGMYSLTVGLKKKGVAPIHALDVFSEVAAHLEEVHSVLRFTTHPLPGGGAVESVRVDYLGESPASATGGRGEDQQITCNFPVAQT